MLYNFIGTNLYSKQLYMMCFLFKIFSFILENKIQNLS